MKDDKFEKLMSVFREWAKTLERGAMHQPTITISPDGSGVLQRYVCDTVMEFADIDEVIAYMERRIKAATVSE